jgi:hypothetical protein
MKKSNKETKATRSRYVRIAIVLLIAIVVAIIGMIMEEGYRPFIEARDKLREKIYVGMTVKELKERLGEPSKIFNRKEDGETCAINGWEKPEKEYEEICFVYFGDADAIAYVYVGSDNIVSYFFVGGS